MQEKNLDYLRDNLKYMGFGENAAAQLEAALKEGKPAFTIPVQAEFNRQPIEAQLHFRKSNETDRYFFNKYDAVLKHEKDASLDRQATFHLNKGTGITLKEAFNLLNGRAVFKDLTTREGEAYKAWVQLDLSKRDDKGQYPVNLYHERYGFDLEKTLAAHPIRELRDEAQKDDLVRSLQKGNLQAVTYLTEVGQERRFLEAAPRFKSVNQYDEQLKPIRQGMARKEGIENSNTQKQKEGPNTVAEEDASLKKTRTRKKGLSL